MIQTSGTGSKPWKSRDFPKRHRPYRGTGPALACRWPGLIDIDAEKGVLQKSLDSSKENRGRKGRIEQPRNSRPPPPAEVVAEAQAIWMHRQEEADPASPR